MSTFSDAFDYVHATLHDLRESGAAPKASRASVERLAVRPLREREAPAEPKPKPADPVSRAAPPRASTEASPFRDQPAPGSGASLSRELPPASTLAPAEGTKAERLAAMRGPVLAWALELRWSR